MLPQKKPNGGQRYSSNHRCESLMCMTLKTIVSSVYVASLATCQRRSRESEIRQKLLCIHLTDRTGCVDMRSWSHSESDFSTFWERPVMLRRVRVTSFGGLKILELLEGSGTDLVADFDGADDLSLY